MSLGRGGGDAGDSRRRRQDDDAHEDSAEDVAGVVPAEQHTVCADQRRDRNTEASQRGGHCGVPSTRPRERDGGQDDGAQERGHRRGVSGGKGRAVQGVTGCLPRGSVAPNLCLERNDDEGGDGVRQEDEQGRARLAEPQQHADEQSDVDRHERLGEGNLDPVKEACQVVRTGPVARAPTEVVDPCGEPRLHCDEERDE
jgi:hypothetical protein